MNEQTLWELVEKRLRASKKGDGKVPEPTRDYLRKRGYVEDACLQDDRDRAVEIIINEIDALTRAYPGGTGSGGEIKKRTIPAEIETIEDGHATSLAEIQAMWAERDVAPLRPLLRETGLSDHPEEVMRLIAAADKSPEEGQDDLASWVARAAHELRKACNWFAEEYGWEEEAAARFILTGEPPHANQIRVNQIRVTYELTNKSGASIQPSRGERVLGRIILEASPAVPPEAVECVYRNAQRKVRGKHYRPLSLRRLEVLKFVESHTDKNGNRPPYEALWRLWNERNPDWSYASYRSFAKAHREALRELRSAPSPIPSLTIASGARVLFDLKEAGGWGAATVQQPG
ncbi:hypothetical protein [Rubrobacter calidifluminis]|uniref:hypothetical protein n=1 Tax=Rubrobacter calidifluminis TaxID=1392640 RepID=UPI00236099F1|nr:hypothetical protein [Rubrobacter calidifluminis]